MWQDIYTVVKISRVKRMDEGFVERYVIQHADGCENAGKEAWPTHYRTEAQAKRRARYLYKRDYGNIEEVILRD